MYDAPQEEDTSNQPAVALDYRQNETTRSVLTVSWLARSLGRTKRIQVRPFAVLGPTLRITSANSSGCS